jgi:hypothetical protein
MAISSDLRQSERLDTEWEIEPFGVVTRAHANEIVTAGAKAAGGVLGIGLSALSVVLGAVTLIFLMLFLMMGVVGR